MASPARSSGSWCVTMPSSGSSPASITRSAVNRILVERAERADQRHVPGHELGRGVERHRPVVPGEAHLEEAPLAIAQVGQALGPGSGFARAPVDDVGAEAPWRLADDGTRPLLRRPDLSDV